MIGTITDRLYNLLPAVYRIRDADEGQPLRALFAVLEQELLAVEQDIDGLYDNWFIETCDEWVVPYIGDLVKVPGLHLGGFGTYSLRAYVANVLKYRRRKGTASVLEQMANDVTGWVSRVVEFKNLLAATQHVNHVRPENLRTPDLRDTNSLELPGGPFETAAHTADVRRVASGRGKYNIPNIGIFLWRLQSYWVSPSEAYSHGSDRYSFNPLGADAPLFNRPQTETEITHIAEEHNAPAPLRRRPLYDELEARRAALAADETPRPVYFGRQPVFEVYLNGEQDPVAPEQIMICDLSNWPSASAGEDIRVIVDPQLGRLALPAGGPPASRVEVGYAYGFSSDIGGGPYDRSESLVDLFKDERTIWWAGVSGMEETGQTNIYKTIAEAVNAWNEQSAAQVGVIAIMDSSTYQENLTGDNTIIIPADRTLLIVAATWRSGPPPAANPAAFDGDLNKLLVAEDLRPILKGNIEVTGESVDTGEPGNLILNGLMINGKLTVLQGGLGGLTLSHCTVAPAEGAQLVVTSDTNSNDELAVSVDKSICGTIQAPEHIKSLRIIDSIVDSAVDPEQDGYPATALSADNTPGFGPATTIERSTLFGTVFVREMTLATETIFTENVTAERLQAGCVRYSFVPPGSRAPRRFRCQPDLESTAQIDKAQKDLDRELTDTEKDAIKAEVEGRLYPSFTSTDYGDPGYGQLSTVCPEEIRIGAENGSEMGAFSHLKQPQRETNLRVNLNEYLRFGMEAGIFYVN
jgi:hypothetical protein